MVIARLDRRINPPPPTGGGGGRAPWPLGGGWGGGLRACTIYTGTVTETPLFTVHLYHSETSGVAEGGKRQILAATLLQSAWKKPLSHQHSFFRKWNIQVLHHSSPFKNKGSCLYHVIFTPNPEKWGWTWGYEKIRKSPVARQMPRTFCAEFIMNSSSLIQLSSATTSQLQGFALLIWIFPQEKKTQHPSNRVGSPFTFSCTCQPKVNAMADPKVT